MADLKVLPKQESLINISPLFNRDDEQKDRGEEKNDSVLSHNNVDEISDSSDSDSIGACTKRKLVPFQAGS